MIIHPNAPIIIWQGDWIPRVSYGSPLTNQWNVSLVGFHHCSEGIAVKSANHVSPQQRDHLAKLQAGQRCSKDFDRFNGYSKKWDRLTEENNMKIWVPQTLWFINSGEGLGYAFFVVSDWLHLYVFSVDCLWTLCFIIVIDVFLLLLLCDWTCHTLIISCCVHPK